MPKRLLLEGSDLETLLLRVRAEMGPQAKVIKAERVRTGGVGGFFAKERFELTVEVPDPATGVGVLDTEPQAVRSSPLMTPASRGPVPPVAPAVSGIDALLDAADAADGPVHDEDLPVSTERDSFASILDSVRQLAYETSTGAPVRDPAPAVPRATTAPVPNPEVAPEPVPVVLGKSVRPAEFVAVRTTGASFGELVDLGVPRRILEQLPPGQGRYTLSQVLSHVPRAPRLVREPASVVVVAGVGEPVIDTASVIARRLGLTDSEIGLAGRFTPRSGYGPWVLTGMSARRLRAATVETENTLVVALGVGVDASDWSVAAGLVDAFDPDQVWAVVEADRSIRDARRWMGALGEHRPLDAVAACNVTSTTAPAAVLELGVPVGMIDAVPASAVVWAAALSEHLADPQWD
ncbi:hypothetical protein [Sanguibacter sp. 25GB23B1]|uniref:hypothetical protein n=1 Tax=unclassified Sanguibacter TaxID=2645534 RepID=UPI0032AF521E